MGSKRFGPTQIILVALLLGVLAYAGKAVSPKSPEPPKQEEHHEEEHPPVQPTVKSPDAAALEKAAQAKLQAQERASKGAKPVKAPPKMPSTSTPKPAFNPDAVDVSSDYYAQFGMGEKGTKQVDAAVAQAKAAAAAARASSPAPSPTAPDVRPTDAPKPQAVP